MNRQPTWEQRTVGREADPKADERFREIEANGQTTFSLLGLDSRAELRGHARQLRDALASELPFDISLDDGVEDAGHFAVVGYLVKFEKFSAYRFSASLSLYGKLARILVEPEPNWLTPDRVPLINRFVEIVAEAGYEIVPLVDLELPYSGSQKFITRERVDWDYFFFDYW